MKQQSSHKFGGASHRLGQEGSEIRGPVVFNGNYLYSGSLFMGESNQEMQLIYDTGSDWMVVEGRDCVNCEGGRYDPNTSSYYEIVDVLTQNLKYGNLFHFKGKEVQDQVCL